jgi:hypothetical protein
MRRGPAAITTSITRPDGSHTGTRAPWAAPSMALDRLRTCSTNLNRWTVPPRRSPKACPARNFMTTRGQFADAERVLAGRPSRSSIHSSPSHSAPIPITRVSSCTDLSPAKRLGLSPTIAGPCGEATAGRFRAKPRRTSSVYEEKPYLASLLHDRFRPLPNRRAPLSGAPHPDLAAAWRPSRRRISAWATSRPTLRTAVPWHNQEQEEVLHVEGEGEMCLGEGVSA